MFSSPSAAASKAPAITTTEVVPSPASTSWELDKSTIYPGVRSSALYDPDLTQDCGIGYHLCCGMLDLHALYDRRAIVGDDHVPTCRYDLPHHNDPRERASFLHGRAWLVVPVRGLTILSIPFGPKLVRTASAMARAAVMLLWRTVRPRVFCSLLCAPVVRAVRWADSSLLWEKLEVSWPPHLVGY